MSLTVSMCRLFVIIANILTTISGLILIGLGLYGLFSPEMRFYSNAIPLATIILGILVFVISITGCLGAIAENRPTLITFFIILLILVIIQIIFIIITVIDAQNIEMILDKSWDKAYNEHPSIIRDIEDEYSCCGFRNTTDRAVPKRSPEACIKSPWYGYDQSCLSNLEVSYKKHQNTISFWFITLAVIQILSLIFSYILIMYLPTPEEREREYRAEHERLVRSYREDSSGKTQDSHKYGSTSSGAV
ncbi:hypothetical protein Glove_22g107 [Diversispora epigaea]|uniref:Tetraspanin n=1 Tax=Diversispora epigaea TaxID=1348612 RepID=A0A397JLU6_9GLOM|nr:hypothetical protein Glove_22g107 [Diversispora epigaea]